MPANFKNIGVAVSDSKNRVILLIILIAVVVAIVFGIRGLKGETQGVEAAATVGGTPAVEAIPGVGEASREYAKLQREQNLREAERAAKTGTSAVPTIIRASYLGSSEFNQGLPAAAKEEGDLCSIQKLRLAKKAGVSAFELRCRGCSAKALRAAGYTAGELRSAGFSANDLREAGFNAAELKSAGFNAAELKAAGFSAMELKEAGSSAAQLKEAGFNCFELKEAFFTDGELKGAICTDAEIKAANAKGKCSVAVLKRAREAGVTADKLKAQGCSAAALKAAGYTAAELKAAGYSAKKLMDAGFSAQELKDAGFSAKELREAGFTAEALRAAGYTASELKDAGYSDAEISGQCDVAVLRRERATGVSAAELRKRGCGLAALMAAGFTAGELKDAGFSDKELLATGFTADDLKASCSVAALKKARDQGVSAKVLRERGCSSAALRAAGYTAGELRDAGFSAKELKDAGFSAAELKASGFSPAELKDAGFSAKELKDAGYSAAELKAAGFSAGELKEAGFSPQELKDAGFSADQLRQAGFTAEELKEAGFSAEELKTAGFSDGELIRAGVQTQFAGPPAVDAAPEGKPADKSEPADFIAAVEKQAEELDSTTAALERLRQRQAEQISAQERRQRIETFEQGMAAQAGDLINSWTRPPTQQLVAGVETPETHANAMPSAGASETLAGVAGAGKFSLKAGDVFFAVLDTGINSDEVSPVMATIVQGRLKGAKLLGTFQRVQGKVVLSFSTMSVPWLPRSIAISAVAIDQGTARTALADKVDQHYLLRYGTLFASSFLSGLAEAITASGSEIVPAGGTGGDAAIATGTKSDTELGLMALGKVGEQYSSALRENFKTKPTIHVRAGKGIGVLMMQDLQFSSTAPDESQGGAPKGGFWTSRGS